MYPQDIQLLETADVAGFFDIEWDLVLGEEVVGSPDDPSANGLIICHATTQPAAFIALYPGAASGVDGTPAANPLDITASGRITENVFTSQAQNYEDEPVIAFITTLNPNTQMLLPQELQSTGDDVFRCIQQTGIQPPAGDISKRQFRIMQGDTHRLESIEPFLRRGPGVHPGAKIMRLAVTSSNVLDSQEATVGSTVSANMKVPGLDSASPVKAIIGTTTRGRFFGFKLKGSNPDSVFQYLGALLRGRRMT